MLIQVNVEGVKQNVEQDLVPRNEDGSPVKNLLATMTDGVYDIDTEKEQSIQSEAQIQDEINISQTYLDDTDKYMTVDKYEQLTEERKVELLRLREEAREVIRSYE